MRCNLDSSYENEYVSSEFGAKSTFRCSRAVNNSGEYVTYAQQYFEGLVNRILLETRILVARIP